MTPSVKSLMPKTVPKGITSPGLAVLAAAGVLSSFWAENSFPPLNTEASRTVGGLSSFKKLRESSMQTAVVPTLTVNRRRARSSRRLFPCFQKGFMEIFIPFRGGFEISRGACKISAPFYCVTRRGIYFDN